jgi:hypothetical protein
VADLSLVARVRYAEARQEFQIFMNIAQPRSGCLVCGLVTATIQRSIQRELQEAFEQAFPGCRVLFP